MGEFFELPFTKEYIKYNDMMLRYMSAVLGALGEDKFDDPEIEKEQREHLSAIGRRFLRSAELTMALTADRSNINMTVINLGEFMSEFAQKCSAAADCKANIRKGKTVNKVVKTEKNFVVYILLGFIRHTLSLIKSDSADFTIECGCPEDGNAYIHLKCDSACGSDGSNKYASELFDKYTLEMCELLAKRIGAECVIDNTSLKLVFISDNKEYDIHFESGVVTPVGSEFSPYEMMLSDII